MQILIVARVVGIYIHNHGLNVKDEVLSIDDYKVSHHSSFACKIVHETFCKLAVAERDNGKRFANVSSIHSTIFTQALLCKTGSKFFLVRAQDFHALTKNHEGFVDITCLLQSVSSGVSVLGALRACKVNQRKSGYL